MIITKKLSIFCISCKSVTSNETQKWNCSGSVQNDKHELHLVILVIKCNNLVFTELRNVFVCKKMQLKAIVPRHSHGHSGSPVEVNFT